jgi:opacity protein-like surface antigen
MVKTLLPLPLLLLFVALPAAGQPWSVGVGTGPFVFGDFVERTFRVSNETTGSTVTTPLSAATRAGLQVDLQRQLTGRFSLRAAGTFTRAPLALGGDDGVELDAGKLDVTTIALPLIVHINRNGALRFHIKGGPAYAIYKLKSESGSQFSVPRFEGTRSQWGFEAGGGASWNVSDRFAIEGEISDIVTSSPFHEDDVVSARGVDILRPHNVHTTIGVRYRF